MILIIPVVLLALLLTMQVGMWWHTRNVADAAAAAAAHASARGNDGSAAGWGIVSQAGWWSDAAVSVSPGSETVTASVSGSTERIFPFGDWPVSATAVATVERTVAESQRP